MSLQDAADGAGENRSATQDTGANGAGAPAAALEGEARPKDSSTPSAGSVAATVKISADGTDHTALESAEDSWRNQVWNLPAEEGEETAEDDTGLPADSRAKAAVASGKSPVASAEVPAEEEVEIEGTDETEGTEVVPEETEVPGDVQPEGNLPTDDRPLPKRPHLGDEVPDYIKKAIQLQKEDKSLTWAVAERKARDFYGYGEAAGSRTGDTPEPQDRKVEGEGKAVRTLEEIDAEIEASIAAEDVAAENLDRTVEIAERRKQRALQKEKAEAEAEHRRRATEADQAEETRILSEQGEAVRFYPEIGVKDSALAQKTHEIYARLVKAGDERQYSPLAITRLAAKELDIAPIDPEAKGNGQKPVANGQGGKPATTPSGVKKRATTTLGLASQQNLQRPGPSGHAASAGVGSAVTPIVDEDTYWASVANL